MSNTSAHAKNVYLNICNNKAVVFLSNTLNYVKNAFTNALIRLFISQIATMFVQLLNNANIVFPV